MKLNILQVGAFEVNCAIVETGERIFVIDPGGEAGRIIDFLSQAGLTPDAILLTHAHFDHIGAIPAMQARWPSLAVYIHPEDAKVITHPLNVYPPDYPAIPRPDNLRDCRELAEAEVIETPGHTPGGVCYHFRADGTLFSGDTLFAGSIGRTDLPGGDMATLMKSLARLTELPEATRVIPGHGRETTIAAEKRGNPFLT